ncbi:hypothetical protein AB838_16635 [Rhodobacteraceae bacterium (ex Bugula neritina AB1)]|nr:hypothetical protein AB838_16635 [Rhodobacteraceae bacterium (ex Bugula neritina AB1)]
MNNDLLEPDAATAQEDAETAALQRLLVAFWLHERQDFAGGPAEQLARFVADTGYSVAFDILHEAANEIAYAEGSGDIDGWMALASFAWHPDQIWKLLLDGVELSDGDAQLTLVATFLAEPLLSHYGSCLPLFAEQVTTDPKFERMITGIWRAKMSDRVWARLRVLQAHAPDPLASMLPIGEPESETNSAAESLSRADRMNDDKGLFYRDIAGAWFRPPVPRNPVR